MQNLIHGRFYKHLGLHALSLAVLYAMVPTAHADTSVQQAQNVQFVGLSRVLPARALSVLPQDMLMDEEFLAQSIHALYATGQFFDVQGHIKDGVATFYVSERPLIADVSLKGNKLIPKDALNEGLKHASIAAGQPLKEPNVFHTKQELSQQYLSQGYYNSKIDINATPLEGNRVRVDVVFDEGKPARVQTIDIEGNSHFSDRDLRAVMPLKQKRINPLSRADRYNDEKLDASIDAIKQEYLNEGFVRANVHTKNATLSEDKQSVMVHIGVDEGERYQFGQTRFFGDFDDSIITQSDLQALLKYAPNKQYSQEQLAQTTSAISQKLGDDGYYYAQIRPITTIHDDSKTVDVDYYIDPAQPVYVRRIHFNGNIKTKDEVLRREMRQLESAPASSQKIQLSRARLMRTGFFKTVNVQTKPVQGMPDQIDVIFEVEEQPSGSSTIAAGYSQGGGATFQLDLSQNNFMGTGNKVNAAFSRSQTRDAYNLSLTNPYFTEDGVSQSLGAYYNKTKYNNKSVANYVTDSLGANLSFGYPIDEHQRISLGVTADKTHVRGGQWMGISNVKQLLDDGGQADFIDSASFSGTHTTYGANIGYSYSNLDRAVFPTDGISHDVALTLGFGDKTYQKATYSGNIYQPFFKGSILRGYTKLGYGKNLPFYENFYAGGWGSVRGYKPSSLGPRSQTYARLANGYTEGRGEEIGANAQATFGAELILPLPFKADWTANVRPVIFAEGGQVFDTTKLSQKYVDMRKINPALATKLTDDNAIVPLANKDNTMRYSAGAGITWYTPIGPLSISYAIPIANKTGDDIDRVQFQIGSVF